MASTRAKRRFITVVFYPFMLASLFLFCMFYFVIPFLAKTSARFLSSILLILIAASGSF